MQKDLHLPFSKTNYIMMAVSVGVILLGYIAMAEGSVEGFLPLVVSPILLVLGYCVILPLAILYRSRKGKTVEQLPSRLESQSFVTK